MFVHGSQAKHSTRFTDQCYKRVGLTHQLCGRMLAGRPTNYVASRQPAAGTREEADTDLS